MKFSALSLLAALQSKYSEKFDTGCEPCIMLPRSVDEEYTIFLPLVKPYAQSIIGVTKHDLSRPMREVLDEIYIAVESTANTVTLSGEAFNKLESSIEQPPKAPQSLRDLMQFNPEGVEVTVKLMLPDGLKETMSLSEMKLFCKYVEDRSPGMLDKTITIEWSESKHAAVSDIFGDDVAAHAWALAWKNSLV